jgi:hypothetical protein
MADYLQIEELPRNYQLYFNEIKKRGFDDIRNIYLHNYGNGIDLNFTIWVDVEDVIDGKIETANELRYNKFEKVINHEFFGIDDVRYRVKYKNKHSFADKILPDLKRELKSTKFSPMINSVRFMSLNDDTEEPVVSVILRKNINLTWDSIMKLQLEIKDFLEEYKRRNGLIRLDTRVK